VLQNNDFPIMTEKFRRIDKQYVLSDSSVNVYGFRLLTEGYQPEQFQKNPIGYYMHRREDGIALKWEDIKIEDDRIVGVPVINLANERGEQIGTEAENGFLNAASMGHIVVLEYSTDEAMMLPGQTGPTITKWYNKECSLVDIPGNNNALTCLYDANEHVINLADIGAGGDGLLTIGDKLKADQEAAKQEVLDGVQLIAEKARHLAAENKLLLSDLAALKQEMSMLVEARDSKDILLLLERALEDKKITVALKALLAQDYAANREGLIKLLAAMPAYRSITEQLKMTSEQTEANWTWDDYEQNDPAGKKLKDLRANDPNKYRELFDKKFNA